MTLKQIATEYLAANPTMPSLTAAKRLHKLHPDAFATVESARSTVRSVRGNNGAHNRPFATVPKPNGAPGESWRELPESFASTRDPFILEGERIGILSDIHIPYHEMPALDATLGCLDGYEPDVILLNGDIVDFHQLSVHEKDPRARSMAQELSATKQFLGHLIDRYPHTRIVYKLGNHEDRLERFLARKAPELSCVEEFRAEHILGLKDLGIEMVDGCRVVMAGGLSILHGHEHRYGFVAPVNPARGLFMRAKESALMGHQHRTSEHTEVTLGGSMITCWSTGCLCELSPRYAPYNSWNHGFAVVDVQGSDSWHVRNMRIIDGVIV